LIKVVGVHSAASSRRALPAKANAMVLVEG
jgi:hypothetical protein